MSKGKYMHVQEILPEIQGMLREGKGRREVEALFGLGLV